MIVRFTAYHRWQLAAIWWSSAPGPSWRAAMSHSESPRATVIEFDGGDRADAGCVGIGCAGTGDGAGADVAADGDVDAGVGADGDVDSCVGVGVGADTSRGSAGGASVTVVIGQVGAAVVVPATLGVVTAPAAVGAIAIVKPAAPAMKRVSKLGNIRDAHQPAARPKAPG
jgi:hypothetical protein